MRINKESPPIKIGGITLGKLKQYIKQCIISAITMDPGAAGEIKIDFDLQKNKF